MSETANQVPDRMNEIKRANKCQGGTQRWCYNPLPSGLHCQISPASLVQWRQAIELGLATLSSPPEDLPEIAAAIRKYQSDANQRTGREGSRSSTLTPRPCPPPPPPPPPPQIIHITLPPALAQGIREYIAHVQNAQRLALEPPSSPPCESERDMVNSWLDWTFARQWGLEGYNLGLIKQRLDVNAIFYHDIKDILRGKDPFDYEMFTHFGLPYGVLRMMERELYAWEASLKRV